MITDDALTIVLSKDFDPDTCRIGIIVSRFNTDITDRMVTGATACLTSHGFKQDSVEIIHVPGAWELPQATSAMLRLDRHDAIITLGCVIRGETPHFDYVCSAANDGIATVARDAPIPIVFGVLTTNTYTQALERAGEGQANKGYQAAMAALQMIDLYGRLAAN